MDGQALTAGMQCHRNHCRELWMLGSGGVDEVV